MSANQYTKASSERLPQWKENALIAAKELFYGEKVIQKILNAKTESQAARILYGARNAQ